MCQILEIRNKSRALQGQLIKRFVPVFIFPVSYEIISSFWIRKARLGVAVRNVGLKANKDF